MLCLDICNYHFTCWLLDALDALCLSLVASLPFQLVLMDYGTVGQLEFGLLLILEILLDCQLNMLLRSLSYARVCMIICVCKFGLFASLMVNWVSYLSCVVWAKVFKLGLAGTRSQVSISAFIIDRSLQSLTSICSLLNSLCVPDLVGLYPSWGMTSLLILIVSGQLKYQPTLWWTPQGTHFVLEKLWVLGAVVCIRMSRSAQILGQGCVVSWPCFDRTSEPRYRFDYLPYLVVQTRVTK